MHLLDKVAIVTGAGRGIGACIAKILASHGAKVALIDVLDNELTILKDEIITSGETAERYICDVSNPETVKRTVDDIQKLWGKIDILVNNAGITRDNLIMRMSTEDWDLVLDVNLKGAFLFTKAVIRPMLKNKYGKIVNISSVVGMFGNAAQANYSASKAGLIGLTKSTAKELGVKGIRCNAVAPGFIETEMTGNLPEKVVKSFLEATPLAIPGNPEDIAQVVMFLCSPESDYITGVVLPVDGGMAM